MASPPPPASYSPAPTCAVFPKIRRCDLFCTPDDPSPKWSPELVWKAVTPEPADHGQNLTIQTQRLTAESSALVGGALLLALACAFLTVGIAARVFRQMQAQTGELSRVSFRMLETQEDIARRFAHELHDELGGSLTAIKSDLSALAADPFDKSRLDDSVKLVEQSISNVRELSQLLRPTILDDFGLDASLRWLVARFGERTRIEVQYDSTFDARLPDQTETHLFRIVQEALTNIARHSQATRVSVNLRAIREGAVRTHASPITAAVSPAVAAAESIGHLVRHAGSRRASAATASKIEPAPGGGLVIDVWAPLSDPQPAEPQKELA